MASRAFRTLEGLAERRRELRDELAAVESELRDAAVDAAREGVPAAAVARLAGVSRESLYQWLRASGVETSSLAAERRLEARIAALEGRHAERVAAKMGELEPAGDRSRRGNWRSGYQWENLGRSGSSRDRFAFWAERALDDDAEAQADIASMEQARGELLAIRAARDPFADV